MSGSIGDGDDSSRRSRARYLVIGLTSVGVVAAASGVAATETAAVDATLGPVLLSVGAVCLVGSLLSWVLVPRQAVPGSTARGVYRSMADNQDALLSVFDLSRDPVYVPTGADLATAGSDAVRLVVLSDGADPPATATPDRTVLGDQPSNRGVALRASGAGFLPAFHRDLTGTPSTRPARLAAQLADAAVESVDLAEAIRVDPDADGESVVFRVRGGVYGATGRDNPVGSFLASGLAAVLDRPVSMSTDHGSTQTETVVTCRLLTVEGAADGEEADEEASADGEATADGEWIDEEAPARED